MTRLRKPSKLRLFFYGLIGAAALVASFVSGEGAAIYQIVHDPRPVSGVEVSQCGVVKGLILTWIASPPQYFGITDKFPIWKEDWLSRNTRQGTIALTMPCPAHVNLTAIFIPKRS